MRPHVPADGVFADLGGGTGDLGSGIARVLGARVIIVDPTPEMLRQVDAHPLVSERLASAEKLPFPDAYFDGLVCSDAFHHIRDQEAAVSEIARVVRPGGVVLILEIRPSRVLTFAERLLGEPGTFRSMDNLEEFLESYGIKGNCVPRRFSYLCVGVVGSVTGGAPPAH